MPTNQISFPAKIKSRFLKRYGPWAVVTGASDGIGREMARNLASLGLNLVLVARRQPLLNQLSVELEGQFSVQTRLIVADLAQPSSIEAIFSATENLEVGLLVACAGFGTSGRFIEASLDNELNMLDVNCRAVLVMSQHFGQRFAAQKRGGIVLMSSLLAFQGVPLSAHYAATKAYIQTLAEGLHIELASFGVDVIASAPGPIHSGFANRAEMTMTLAASPATVSRGTLIALTRRKVTTRPGWLSKTLEGSLSFLPRRGRIWAMGRVMQSLTNHKN